MIGGLLDKISASLGKSFVFTGLMPAAILIIVFGWYRLGFEQLWNTAPSFTEDLKKITALGITWLGLGFVLFSIRTWIFDWFQRVPRGPLGSLLLRRSLRKRDDAQDNLELLEWQITVVQWPGFESASAIYRPRCYPLPNSDFALGKSQAARSRLSTMASTVIHPGWGDCRILLAGLSALFAITADKQVYAAHQGAIDAELAAWRNLNGERIKIILNNLLRHVEREWAAAYEENIQFAKGPWVYPTSIGNRLAALDDYAQRRYGIATATIWDRLWWVLPSASRQEVAEARLTVETLVNLATVLLLCASGIGVAALAGSFDWTAHYVPPVTLGGVLLGLGCLIGAFGSYKGAVFAIKALATKMMTLIDTNRLQLLAALGYSFETVRDEISAFNELNPFFVQARARQPDRKLKLPKSSAEKEDKAASGKKKKEGEQEEDGEESGEDADDNSG